MTVIESSSSRKVSLNPDESQENGEKAPEDVYNIVYILFFWHGLLHTLPWTFFTNAHDYWMYKFRDLAQDADPSELSRLQQEFAPVLSAMLQISTISATALTIFFGHKLPFKFRLYYTLLIVLICFTSASVFINVNTDGWQTGFFVLVMVFVALINAANAVFGMNEYSILAQFPTEYLGPYVNGQGLAAIFASTVEIVALAIGISTEVSALIYFWIGNAVIALAFISTVLVQHNNAFFSYHMRNFHKTARKEMMTYAQIRTAVKKIYPLLIAMVLLLLSINAVMPSVTSLVNSEGKGNGNPWNDTYFTPVISFFLPAVCDLIGRVIALKLKYTIGVNWFIVYGVVRMVVFVPLIMLCNVPSRKHLPLVFPHDYQYIIIITIFSIMGGYQISMITYLIPKLVPEEELEGSFHVYMVLSGVIMGILCFVSFVSVDII